MSNFLYPLGIIANQKVSPQSKVVSDAFEDGSTQTRALWALSNFKRQIQFTHPNLTLAEYRYLRSFYSQRTGMYDSFWYRDNINRKGNVNARFAATVEDTNDGTTFTIPVKLAEIAPIRALPEFDELMNAANGSGPLFWYDANREKYVSHMGQIITDAAAYDSAFQNYPAPWTGGIDLAGTIASQYQAYHFGGTNYALSAANMTGISGIEPGFTLFAIVQSSNPSTKQVLVSVGTKGAGQTLGLVLGADNTLQPWVGDSETWTATKVASVANTWSSVAITWNASNYTTNLFNNAVAIGSESNTRSFVTGPVTLGAASDGSLPATGAYIAHAMAFPTMLGLPSIKILHNLLGYQFGLAIVP